MLNLKALGLVASVTKVLREPNGDYVKTPYSHDPTKMYYETSNHYYWAINFDFTVTGINNCNTVICKTEADENIVSFELLLENPYGGSSDSITVDDTYQVLLGKINTLNKLKGLTTEEQHKQYPELFI